MLRVKDVKKLVFSGLLLVLQAFAFSGGAVAQKSNSLPAIVKQELRKANVPVEAVGIYIQPLSRTERPKIPVVYLNENTSFVPASIMKLVTTYSALEILGPTYRWETKAFIMGSQNEGELTGNLIFQGSGDPKFNLESFYSFLRLIRSKGIREIKGDIILDRSAFESRPFDPAEFDNDPFRPYNAGPDALLLNHKVLEVVFKPNGLDGTVSVLLSPQLDGVAITPPVLKEQGECNSWQKRISLHFSQTQAVFEGEYPLSCGEQSWLVYPHTMDDSDFFRAVFVRAWTELGGTFDGQVRSDITPSNATMLAKWLSPPLADVIKDVNKYSNNVMARHILMTIGTVFSDEPASPERGIEAVKSFLRSKDIPVNGLQIENGSGLSRTERISARMMGKILVTAFDSKVMPEFMSSLPIIGQDGTLWRSMRQNSIVGHAHLKTGAIQDVRAIAGYVLAASGERYVVVFIANHPNAGAIKKVRDTLLNWVYDNG